MEDAFWPGRRANSTRPTAMSSSLEAAGGLLRVLYWSDEVIPAITGRGDATPCTTCRETDIPWSSWFISCLPDTWNATYASSTCAFRERKSSLENVSPRRGIPNVAAKMRRWMLCPLENCPRCVQHAAATFQQRLGDLGLAISFWF